MSVCLKTGIGFWVLDTCLQNGRLDMTKVTIRHCDHEARSGKQSHWDRLNKQITSSQAPRNDNGFGVVFCRSFQ
ncbi:hypothetical protein C1T31_12060 [Hanstruepera neustonica]|uniref:Uncharacterized protein n=1 Tax=Hanstruepera neustonica TaxID=1445657 RepID=A0A2K1DW76_9FLAO|nr:hypothetical protein C1T31_12060 [Hanstruepera neustonica]